MANAFPTLFSPIRIGPRTAPNRVCCSAHADSLATWRALEDLVAEGRCKAIGLSDVGLVPVQEIFEAGRIKPAVVHVESHPYLPEWELLDGIESSAELVQYAIKERVVALDS
jgi:diketogulonate reductase-like aldo/keto reductase